MDNFKENNFFAFILVFLALEAIFFLSGNSLLNQKLQEKNIEARALESKLSRLDLEAKSFSVYDGTDGEKVYSKEGDVQMPLASLTKIMTVVIALEEHGGEKIVPISRDALLQESDYGFLIGEKFKIRELARFTLVGSSNDGAYALSESKDNFIEKMNQKARKIGMEKALFLNPTGLDEDEEKAGAYATAEGMNILAMYAFHAYPEIFDATILPEITINSESGFSHTIKNTDIILDKVPSILFSKTGLTPLSGGNLTILFKDKREHIMAVTLLGSTEKGRFSDMEKIVNALYY